MNDRAASVIALRPTDGSPSVIVREPVARSAPPHSSVHRCTTPRYSVARTRSMHPQPPPSAAPPPLSPADEHPPARTLVADVCATIPADLKLADDASHGFHVAAAQA